MARFRWRQGIQIKISVKTYLISAFEAFLEYDKDRDFPTKVSVECDWGDGTVFNEDLDNMVESDDDADKLRYKITHTYAVNGEYNMTCK